MIGRNTKPMLHRLKKLQHKRQLKPVGARHSNAGFSLIEVLVASLVFTLGLAGFSALLLSSMIGSSQARREGIASIAAANLAEQIRLNPAAIDHYLYPPEYVSKICSGDTLCSPAQQADYDFRFWQLELADRIRHARGLVCRDGTPDDGNAANEQCDGSGPLVIKIFWSGRPAETRETPVEYRYILQIS